MLNFADASTAAVLWSLVRTCAAIISETGDGAWARPGRLGVVTLHGARAPSPLVLVIVGDLSPRYAQERRSLEVAGPLASRTALALTRPWWLVSGHQALHHLVKADYPRPAPVSA